MTEKQRMFVEEYCIDLNGAGAARRAGYSARSAKNQAWKLLRIPEVRNAVDQINSRRLDKLQLRQEEVLEELKTVAFSEGSDASGANVKMASKLRALELLGKHLGLFDGTGSKDAPAVTILEDV